MSVAAILLAAGASTRFGVADKLMADFGGRTLVGHVASALLASRVAEIVVVTRPAAAVGASLPSDPRLHTCVNAEADRGIGRSIATGIANLRSQPDAAIIVPGDMPGLTAALFDQLIDAFEIARTPSVVYPVTADGAQRNPVLWPRDRFAALLSLDGPEGGKALLQTGQSPAIELHVAADSVFDDVDTPGDYARLAAPWRLRER